VRAVLRRPRRAGAGRTSHPSIVAGAEADRSHAAGVHWHLPPRPLGYMSRIGVAPVQRDEPALRFGSLDGCSGSWPSVCETQRAERSQSGGPWLRVLGRGVALIWRLDGQAEEGGEQGRVGLPDQRPDSHWGPAHDQAAAEASELASVSEARPGDALAGGTACLAGFQEVEGSGVVGRHRARRSGAVPLFAWRRGGGCAGARGRPERSGVERSEKPASQAPWELEQGSSFSRCYARPSEPASDGRVKS